jgi:hypothetical protein
MGRAPRFYLHSLTREWDSAPARLGRCTHLKIHKNAPYLVYPGERRGKAWKAFYEANKGVEIFTAKEAAKADNMADSVMSDPVARELYESSAASAKLEHTIHWRIGNRECQSTPDLFNADVEVDLKTSRCCKPGIFDARWGDLRKMAYHGQLAFYADAIAYYWQNNRPVPIRTNPTRHIVAVESEEPHLVSVFNIKPALIEEGRALYSSWFQQLLVCEESNVWPSYSQHAIDVDVIETDEMPSLDWSDEETEESEAAE